MGYRYYDNHPEEIEYPFGHGISNIGEVDGAEVIQLYVGKDVSCVSRPQKELKSFQIVFLKAGERQRQ